MGKEDYYLSYIYVSLHCEFLDIFMEGIYLRVIPFSAKILQPRYICTNGSQRTCSACDVQCSDVPLALSNLEFVNSLLRGLFCAFKMFNSISGLYLVETQSACCQTFSDVSWGTESSLVENQCLTELRICCKFQYCISNIMSMVYKW